MIFCWVKRQVVNKEEPKNAGLPTSSTRFESCPTAFAHLLCNQKEFRMKNRTRHAVFWIDGPLDSQMHGLPKWHSGKNPPANTGDAVSIPGSRRCPEEANGNPSRYACLRNPVGRRAWQATVHAVAKSQTQLKLCAQYIYIYIYI